MREWNGRASIPVEVIFGNRGADSRPPLATDAFNPYSRHPIPLITINAHLTAPFRPLMAAEQRR